MVGRKGSPNSSIALSRRCADFYLKRLHNSLDYLPVTSVFALLVLSSIYFLYTGAKSELAPQEDQGVVIASSTLAPDATLQQKVLYAKQVFEIMKEFPETDHVFQINSPSRVVAGMVLKPWDERSRTSNQLQPIVQQRLNDVAGARIAAFQLPPLPGSQGLPVQFVIKTTDSFNRLDEAAQKFLKAAIDSGMFIFLDTDLKIDNPESVVEIDRDKAAQLGLKMSDVGSAMTAMLGGGYVNYFSLDQRSYKVIPQVATALSPQCGSTAELLRGQRLRRSRSAVGDRAHHDQDGAGDAQSFSAAQQRHDPGRGGPRRRASRRARFSQDPGRQDAAGGLYGRLQRLVAPVYSGILRLRRDLRICDRHHLPFARGIVRKLPRSMHHPGLGADVDCGRADFRQPWRRRGIAEHLHGCRPGDVDGPDQQARDPDCGVCK